MFKFFDQPFFNYMIYKMKTHSGNLLADRVEVRISTLPPPAEPVGKGFVHFAGGVGNSAPKLTLMSRYVEVLRRSRRRQTAGGALAGAEAPTISRSR